MNEKSEERLLKKQSASKKKANKFAGRTFEGFGIALIGSAAVAQQITAVWIYFLIVGCIFLFVGAVLSEYPDKVQF